MSIAEIWYILQVNIMKPGIATETIFVLKFPPLVLWHNKANTFAYKSSFKQFLCYCFSRDVDPVTTGWLAFYLWYIALLNKPSVFHELHYQVTTVSYVAISKQRELGNLLGHVLHLDKDLADCNILSHLIFMEM